MDRQGIQNIVELLSLKDSKEYFMSCMNSFNRTEQNIIKILHFSKSSLNLKEIRNLYVEWITHYLDLVGKILISSSEKNTERHKKIIVDSTKSLFTSLGYKKTMDYFSRLSMKERPPKDFFVDNKYDEILNRISLQIKKIGFLESINEFWLLNREHLMFKEDVIPFPITSREQIIKINKDLNDGFEESLKGMKQGKKPSKYNYFEILSKSFSNNGVEIPAYFTLRKYLEAMASDGIVGKKTSPDKKTKVLYFLNPKIDVYIKKYENQ